MGSLAKGGWIRLHRKAMDNDMYFAEPFDKWHAWQDLLLLVDAKEHDVVTRRGVVHLMPGQGLFGEEKLATRWKWSRNKVRRFFKLLAAQDMAHIDGTPNGTLITIIKWAFYQGRGPTGGTANGTANGTTNGTTDGTLTRIYKEYREGENARVRDPHNAMTSEEVIAMLTAEYGEDGQGGPHETKRI